ncbi:MAG: hypothetical protein KC561_12380, partial [Myxococcales bacterium]|nr:hypothetical protein [Myxococcales bacterium]
VRSTTSEWTQRFPVSPERALELAQPYIEQSFELRRKMHGYVPPERNPHPNWMNDPGTIYMGFERGWYLIVKDSYPYKVHNGWICRQHAVRVHTRTGQVVPPS